MAKKTKEKTNKIKGKSTKDEKFNFNEEIIIGLKRIEADKPKGKVEKQANKTKGNKKKSRVKAKAKQTKTEQTQIKNVKNNVNKKKLKPEQEIAKNKRKAIFKIIKWTMLLCIILGGIIYTLLSPIFNIKTISVIGNSAISTDEIISLSNLQLEQNMFNYRKHDVIKKIKANAYIDSVKINRKVPDTIEIIVAEREAKFMIQFANAYVFINNQGYILEITSKKKSLPIITGTETPQENMQVGNRLCTKDLEKLGDVLKIIESSVSNGLNDYITKIDIKNSDDYILTLDKKKKIVHLGDTSNLSTKMLWILKFNELEGNTQGEIILNMNLNDERNKPYFRKKV